MNTSRNTSQDTSQTDSRSARDVDGHRSSEKALDRVRKLFAKAESVVGTPEAEVLLERAYALLAKYGVDEALARTGPDTAAEVAVIDHVISGSYQPDQVGPVSYTHLTLPTNREV